MASRRRQRSVSAQVHAASVPDANTALLRRLIGDHPEAPAEIHVLARDHLSEHPDNLRAAWIAGREPPSH